MPLSNFLKKIRIKDLPNQLTIFRISVVPIILVLFPLDYFGIQLFCAILFALAAFTDWLDGYIARRYHVESKFGAVLDPIADKLLTGAGIVLLASEQRIWGWLAGLLICRELLISGLRIIAEQQKQSISVSFISKWKTLAIDVAVVCLMVYQPFLGLPFFEVGMLALWVTFILSFASAYMYVKDFIEKNKHLFQ